MYTYDCIMRAGFGVTCTCTHWERGLHLRREFPNFGENVLPLQLFSSIKFEIRAVGEYYPVYVLQLSYDLEFQFKTMTKFSKAQQIYYGHKPLWRVW